MEKTLDLQKNDMLFSCYQVFNQSWATVAYDLIINDISTEEATQELFEVMKWIGYELSPLINNRQKEA